MVVSNLSEASPVYVESRVESGCWKAINPSMYILRIVNSDDRIATRVNCMPFTLSNCDLISPYQSRSPASWRATLKPGSPSSDRTFHLDRYSSRVPAETCFLAQWPRVSRSSRYAICFEGSFGSGLVARYGTAKPQDVCAFPKTLGCIPASGNKGEDDSP